VRGDFEGNHPWVLSLRATNGSVTISLITDYEFVGRCLPCPSLSGAYFSVLNQGALLQALVLETGCRLK
jgi:hypothetical protein